IHSVLIVLACFGSRATKLCSREYVYGDPCLPRPEAPAANRYFREAAIAGAKAAAVAAAVPTLASVKMLPWAKAQLNPTGQALIISTVAGMAYFIVADKTILSMARKHSFEDAPEHLRNTSFD
ncbi:early nodulin-93-like, partial [Triticum aestivum]|uniref:early nodulin-93-like n=1 Tax=Triticum aestivum TaxID=4565 RepID=UPI001D007DCD